MGFSFEGQSFSKGEVYMSDHASFQIPYGKAFQQSQAEQHKKYLSHGSSIDWNRMDFSGVLSAVGLITNPRPESYYDKTSINSSGANGEQAVAGQNVDAYHGQAHGSSCSGSPIEDDPYDAAYSYYLRNSGKSCSD
jgi:hypothetical protein